MGVRDHGSHREVTGISKNWDDTIFQTWAENTFEPLHYSEFDHAGKTVGGFEVKKIAYPHSQLAISVVRFVKGKYGFGAALRTRLHAVTTWSQ